LRQNLGPGKCFVVGLAAKKSWIPAWAFNTKPWQQSKLAWLAQLQSCSRNYLQRQLKVKFKKKVFLQSISKKIIKTLLLTKILFTVVTGFRKFFIFYFIFNQIWLNLGAIILFIQFLWKKLFKLQFLRRQGGIRVFYAQSFSCSILRIWRVCWKFLDWFEDALLSIFLRFFLAFHL